MSGGSSVSMPSTWMSDSATRALNARLGEDRQLLRRVAAGDVHRRIGLGIARAAAPRRAPAAYVQPLRVMRVRMKLHVPLTMPTRAEISLAIRPCESAWMIGMPPPQEASKAMAGVVLLGQREQLAAARGEQALVGGDDRLAEARAPARRAPPARRCRRSARRRSRRADRRWRRAASVDDREIGRVAGSWRGRARRRGGCRRRGRCGGRSGRAARRGCGRRRRRPRRSPGG